MNKNACMTLWSQIETIYKEHAPAELTQIRELFELAMKEQGQRGFYSGKAAARAEWEDDYY